jgi:lysyl-tRNA synthetase class 2
MQNKFLSKERMMSHPLYRTEYEKKLYDDRVASLEKIREVGEGLGLSAAAATYPNSFPVSLTIPELRAKGEPMSADEMEAAPVEAAIAGRVMALRGGFAVLQGGGETVQVYVHKDAVGPELAGLYKALHVGDHVGIRGHLMRTRTGELTLRASEVSLPGHVGQRPLVFLTKAMVALPDKYHGLEDVELRYRQRYVDLIMNSAASKAEEAEGGEAERNVRAVFVKRAAVLRAVRKFFDERGYIEVETPMLHTVAGGATARTFSTHHNAEDMQLTLRVAPELHLKRLVVGGLDRVYEINRNFRNEGVDRTHNPEFTMLEFYQAYANYWDLMDLTEELIKSVAMDVNGTTVTQFDGNEIDLGLWTKLSMREALVKFWIDEGARPSLADLADEANFRRWYAKAQEFAHQIDDQSHLELFIKMNSANKPYLAGNDWGKLLAYLFEEVSESHLVDPTIIYDFPLAVSPLSKVKADEPDWVERFEFYIGGFEVGNAFSELNDAADQYARFEAQLAEKARGDDEAMEMDEDYVRSLGYGLPPTAGEGIGIDRLTMLLTGSRSIRDVILFPLMRAQKAVVDVEPVVGGESAE